MNSYFKIFIILFFIFFNFFPVDSKYLENHSLRKIESNFLLAWELDKKIIDKYTFNLAEKKFLLPGDTQKYILVNNNGLKKLWLFKANSPSIISTEVSASKLGSLCGLNLPYVHKISLPINSTIVEGTIQRFIVDPKRIKDLRNLTTVQLDELQKHFIFDYFIENSDISNSHFLIVKNNNKLYGVDKDDAFEFAGDREKEKYGNYIFADIADFAFDKYGFFWNSYTDNGININLYKGLSLANFIRNIDDDIFSEIFKSVFKLKRNTSIDSLEKFIVKKNALPEIIFNFYKTISKENRKSIFEIDEKEMIDNYNFKVLNRVKKKIVSDKKILKQIEKENIFKQENINVVASQAARRFIVNEIFLPSFKKDFRLKRSDWNYFCQRLKKMRRDSSSVTEKLAITLYILKVNKLYLKEIMWFDENEFYKKVLITMNPKLLKRENIKKEYLSILNNKDSLVDIEKEYYYALSLIDTIKKNRKQ